MSHLGEWEVVIGLEIHTQLSTQSKIFSGASTKFGAEPNTQACAIDLGMPGVLPVVNKEVYRKAVTFGLGIGAEINKRSVFDRKNYFYPDLPKGYQITQLESPIVMGGHVEIVLDDGTSKVINVTRAHLEEDAGKSLHENYHNQTGIDLNRAGTPLLEIGRRGCCVCSVYSSAGHLSGCFGWQHVAGFSALRRKCFNQETRAARTGHPNRDKKR